jgi:hypothetical protein
VAPGIIAVGRELPPTELGFELAKAGILSRITRVGLDTNANGLAAKLDLSYRVEDVTRFKSGAIQELSNYD